MRRLVPTALAAASAALVCAGAASATPPAAPASATRVVRGLAASTGLRLHVDQRASLRGQYTALVGSGSTTEIGAYGRFVVFVVNAARLGQVSELLANTHTGAVAPPGAAGIHWEHGSTLTGSGYWLGKKRYGTNVVLWWYGSAARVTPAFRRLHYALLHVAG